MTAAKHTSQEWTVLDLRGVYVIAGAGLTVADVVHQARPGEQLANAHLIAAAPELLAVLKATLGNVISLGPAGALEGIPNYAPYRVWQAEIERVIAKATGSAR